MMRADYSTFVNITNHLMATLNIRDTFIDSIPQQISQVFFDNPVVNSYEQDLQYLLTMLFNEQIVLDLNYFLYEWKAGDYMYFSNNPQKHHFGDEVDESSRMQVNTRQDFFAYIKRFYFPESV